MNIIWTAVFLLERFFINFDRCIYDKETNILFIIYNYINLYGTNHIEILVLT